jgi:hypothetical protein
MSQGCSVPVMWAMNNKDMFCTLGIIYDYSHLFFDCLLLRKTPILLIYVTLAHQIMVSRKTPMLQIHIAELDERRMPFFACVQWLLMMSVCLAAFSALNDRYENLGFVGES